MKTQGGGLGRLLLNFMASGTELNSSSNRWLVLGTNLALCRELRRLSELYKSMMISWRICGVR
jgi:hypothetical protein